MKVWLQLTQIWKPSNGAFSFNSHSDPAKYTSCISDAREYISIQPIPSFIFFICTLSFSVFSFNPSYFPPLLLLLWFPALCLLNSPWQIDTTLHLFWGCRVLQRVVRVCSYQTCFVQFTCLPTCKVDQDWWDKCSSELWCSLFGKKKTQHKPATCVCSLIMSAVSFISSPLSSVS